jgi:hypothetical protein
MYRTVSSYAYIVRNIHAYKTVTGYAYIVSIVNFCKMIISSKVKFKAIIR